MSTYVKAVAGPHNTVIYTDSTGRFFRFSGGSRAWRNNNPGNLWPGEVSKRHSQIGVAAKFAVFPSKQIGDDALIDSLKTTHENRSIDELVGKFAPASDGNDVKAYRKFLHDETGVKGDKKVKDFTAVEFEKLWKAIETMEGYWAGTIVEVSQIIHVQKGRNGIYDYEIKKKGWISKSECINLAKAGKLDVVVCTSHARHEYVRARKGSPVNHNLSRLVVSSKETHEM